MYERALVLKFKEKMDLRHRIREDNLGRANLNNPKRVDLDSRLSTLMSGLESLRTEQGAAFNIMMDELSKIKCQLVELSPPTGPGGMPLPPSPH